MCFSKLFFAFYGNLIRLRRSCSWTVVFNAFIASLYLKLAFAGEFFLSFLPAFFRKEEKRKDWRGWRRKKIY
jgi:hypothetical protein